MIAKLTGTPERTERNVYVLIDGAQMDALKLIYSHDDSPEFDQLYRGMPHQSALEVSPCIVKPSDTSRLWAAEPVWRSAGLVVESNADMQTLADHFRSLISVRLPDQTFAYLRFYSPTRVHGLLSAFNPNERAQFSGPVLKWRYFDATTGWKSTAIHSSEQAQDYEAREEGWFQLTGEHIETISAHKEANFICALVNTCGLPLTPENESLMRTLVERGRHFGFRTEAELASYAEIAAYHPKAIDQPGAMAILSDQKSPAYERLAALDNFMAQGGA
ncbi:DUF4123 domain-containing protein [Marinobacter piscensis]|uniref:DUF4123 domain-containing protein n=1 Tax=Marinobacter piscensis TaxID=1562308 RepID=UPI00119E6C4C|nr:DUF4123 domain-containing protein [Marinobacter piscensis]